MINMKFMQFILSLNMICDTKFNMSYTRVMGFEPNIIIRTVVSITKAQNSHISTIVFCVYVVA